MCLSKNHLISYAALFILFLGFVHPVAVSAQNAATVANRQTALRCLQLAKDYINQKDWAAAGPQIDLGLVYDDSVSDLWYLKAVVKVSEGAVRAEILPLVQQALNLADWVDYNRDGARILYADILSDTGFYDKALSILDEQPFLYFADAEYIRVKSYYRLRTPENLVRARDRIDAARRIYPNDSRFARLFLKNEYALIVDDKIDVQVQKIAVAFIAAVPRYTDTDSELQLYAALFAGNEERSRMLDAFQAKELRHPLFASAALKAGLLTQKEAVEYFVSFADTSVSLEYLMSFSAMITEDEPKQFLSEYLTSYDGLLTIDTDGDLEQNLFVDYMRGRPQSIKWDKDNNGVNDLTAECDFGVPLSVSVPKENLELGYDLYPYINKISMQNKEGRNLLIALANEQLSWSPFDISAMPFFTETLGCEFYVPIIIQDSLQIDESQIVSAATSYEVDSEEYAGARISFSILHGQPQTADYTRRGKRYAQVFFVDGLPASRTIDKDGDGVFETTETYDYDTDGKMNISEADNSQLMINLYGHSSENKNQLYIKMIQVDQNGDTMPDFTEEYLPKNGKITSWDSDNDGQWDIRYIRYPQNPGENLLEDTLIYLTPGKVLTTVSTSDGEPIKIVSDKIEYSVTRGDNDDFYWVGNPGAPDDERVALEVLSAANEQGRTVVASNDDKRILAVQMGSKFYGRILEAVSSEEPTLSDIDEKSIEQVEK